MMSRDADYLGDQRYPFERAQVDPESIAWCSPLHTYSSKAASTPTTTRTIATRPQQQQQ